MNYEFSYNSTDAPEFETAWRDALVLAQEPYKIVQLAAQLRTACALANASESQPHLAKIRSYSHHVLKAFSLCEWDQLNTHEFSSETAITLLDELSRTKGSDNETDTYIHAMTEHLLDGWINGRFTKSQDWSGALQSLHALTEVALSDTDELTRIDTWMDLFLETRPKVLRIKSISRLGLFFAFRNPSPESETNLRLGMDINNALSTAASASGRSDAFGKYSAQNVTHFGSILNTAIETSQFPHEFRKAYQETVNAIHIYYPRYMLLLHFIQGRAGGSASDTFSIAPDAISQYPNTVISMQTFLRKQTLQLAGLSSARTSLMESVKEDAKHFDKNSVIVPFVKDGFSGYYIFRPNTFPGDTIDEQAACVLTLMDTNGLEEYLQSQQQNAHKSDGVLGLVCHDPTYGPFKVYIFTHDHPLYLENILNIMIPDELQQEGIGLLRDNLRIQRDIAQTFTKSLTHKGVRFDLHTYEELPGIFDGVTLKKTDRGKFIFSIDLPGAAYVNGVISMTDGQVKANLDGDASKLSPDITWVLTHLALKLFHYSCCIPLNDIKPPGYAPGEGEKQYDKDEVPAGIVRVGGYRQDGSPKQFTNLAVAKHLADAYDLRFEDESPLEVMLQVAAEMHAKTLVDFNNQYRIQYPHRDDYLTWRSAHETGKVGNPCPIEAPEHLFQLN